MIPSELDRFTAKISFSVDSECWTWTGAKRSHGYGGMWFRGRFAPAHRLAYEHWVGVIPDGFVIDHKCRNPLCVNPAHLDAVSWTENLLRGNHPTAVVCRTGLCKRGHSMVGAVVTKQGTRWCRTCARKYKREESRARRALLRESRHGEEGA